MLLKGKRKENQDKESASQEVEVAKTEAENKDEETLKNQRRG